jgi:hypothetical protein
VDNINLNKSVFNKEEFNKTVDTSFRQLIKPQITEKPLFTVEEFFEKYEFLFFEIPKEGENNSHEYLVKRSGEYINYDKLNEEIEALLEEITELRQEILDLNQKNFDLEMKNSGVNTRSSAKILRT